MTQPSPDRGKDGVAPAAGDEVIDLRDPIGAPDRPPSGRPAELQPGHRVITVTGGEMWARAEAFVYEIYREIGYCEPSPRNRVEELAPWNPRSRFHAVVDERSAVVGAVRTIFGAYDELPVAQFERTEDVHADPVCELSSLTVSGEVRSTGVIEHLYRAAWLDAFRSRSNAIVALIDDWLLEVFQATYRLPFRQIGIGQDYMGSFPVPVAMPLDGDAYALTAEQNPEFWAWTLEAVTDDEAAEWHLPLPAGAAATSDAAQGAGSPSR